MYSISYEDDAFYLRNQKREVVCWAFYEDAGINPETDLHPETSSEIAELDKKIDAYIERQLGYVPDYEAC